MRYVLDRRSGAYSNIVARFLDYAQHQAIGLQLRFAHNTMFVNFAILNSDRCCYLSAMLSFNAVKLSLPTHTCTAGGADGAAV